MFFSNPYKEQLPPREKALPGREQAMSVTNKHAVLGSALLPPYPEHSEMIVFGLGCFWGAERKFWQLEGVISTAVGYSAGFTPNPTYEEVCSGLTGHNEVVQVVFDPQKISLDKLLATFWESHNPTQGMRQGNDRGTQYRSGIYYFSAEQKQQAEASQKHFAEKLRVRSEHPITTEILPAAAFYLAEDYHQQYLHKNPNGYCGLGGLGITY